MIQDIERLQEIDRRRKGVIKPHTPASNKLDSHSDTHTTQNADENDLPVTTEAVTLS